MFSFLFATFASLTEHGFDLVPSFLSGNKTLFVVVDMYSVYCRTASVINIATATSRTHMPKSVWRESTSFTSSQLVLGRWYASVFVDNIDQECIFSPHYASAPNEKKTIIFYILITIIIIHYIIFYW